MKKKTFHFWGKALAVSLIALVAAFSFASCSDDDDEKENNKEEQEQIIPTKEVYLNLYENNIVIEPNRPDDVDKILDYEYMTNLISQPDVKYVILSLAGRWDPAGPKAMHRLSEKLEPIVNINPQKVKGDGDFVKRGLPRGTMSGNDQAIADSLWFTSVGFTFLGQQ